VLKNKEIVINKKQGKGIKDLRFQFWKARCVLGAPIT